jgi:hypothetical protein
MKKIRTHVSEHREMTYLGRSLGGRTHGDSIERRNGCDAPKQTKHNVLFPLRLLDEIFRERTTLNTQR